VISAAVLTGGVGLHVMEVVMKYGGMPTVMTAGKLVLVADIVWYVFGAASHFSL
jgi:hypothetical protein